MNVIHAFKGLGAAAMLLAMSTPLLAAPPDCKGPNKNDPGCQEATPEEATAAQVESVTVDWFNERFIVRGTDFSGSTVFLLGGSAGPFTTANVTATELDLPFDAVVAAEVTTRGNYRLLVDGNEQLSVFIDSQIVDPAATGCPCQAAWETEFMAAGLWPTPETDCLEIEGPAVNDIADISGTVYSTPGDPSAYPQYPIGASFYPGEPDNSVCRLVSVDASTNVTDLVNERINELQQADCAAYLKLDICDTVIPVP